MYTSAHISKCYQQSLIGHYQTLLPIKEEINLKACTVIICYWPALGFKPKTMPVTVHTVHALSTLVVGTFKHHFNIARFNIYKITANTWH